MSVFLGELRRVAMKNGLKKEAQFYNFFMDFSSRILEVGQTFQELVNDYSNVESKAAALKKMETECDVMTHNILEELNNSFITPFDREDIYAITKSLDDIVDCIEQVGSRFIIFNVKEMRPECAQFAFQIMLCLRELDMMFKHLPEIKKSSIVRDQIIEINRLENEGDVFYRQNLSDLFKNEKDPIELIKWKHLYEQMEECLDACETVANCVEGVVMKYA